MAHLNERHHVLVELTEFGGEASISPENQDVSPIYSSLSDQQHKKIEMNKN